MKRYLLYFCISFYTISGSEIDQLLLPLDTHVDTFSQQKKSKKTRDEIQEDIVEACLSLALLCIDELEELGLLLGQLLVVQTNFQKERLSSWIEKRLAQLDILKDFLKTGIYTPVSQHTTHTREVLIEDNVGSLLRNIACVQREIMRILRAFADGDTNCCFVASRIKKNLEAYAQNLTKISDEAKSELETLKKIRKGA